jgi:hypothetical protein
MARIALEGLEHQHRRWMRPDAHRWMRPDVREVRGLDQYRFVKPRLHDGEHGGPLSAETAGRLAAYQDLLRLQSEVKALRREFAQRRLSCALKAGFNPDQPRDELGRWTDTGGGNSDPRVMSDTVPDISWMPGAQYAQNDTQRYSVNLAEEEAPVGIGHTIREHVGKTDAELIDVLRQEWRQVYLPEGRATYYLPAQGSFSSPISANDFVNQMLQDNRATVDAVANGQGEAVLEKRFGYMTGKEAFRAAPDAEPYIRNTYGVRVVIRHDDRVERGYRVLTAFPMNKLRTEP